MRGVGGVVDHVVPELEALDPSACAIAAGTVGDVMAAGLGNLETTGVTVADCEDPETLDVEVAGTVVVKFAELEGCNQMFDDHATNHLGVVAAAAEASAKFEVADAVLAQALLKTQPRAYPSNLDWDLALVALVWVCFGTAS